MCAYTNSPFTVCAPTNRTDFCVLHTYCSFSSCKYSKRNASLRVCLWRILRLIPRSLQLQAHVNLASLGWRHKWGKCAKSYARRSVCFCSQSGGDASIGLITLQLQSCDWGRRAVGLVRLEQKVALQNDGDFTDVLLIYHRPVGPHKHTRRWGGSRSLGFSSSSWTRLHLWRHVHRSRALD